MISIINAVIFLAACIWMIVERFKFEKEHKGQKSEYITLFKKYNTLQIIMFAALALFCVESFLNK